MQDCLDPLASRRPVSPPLSSILEFSALKHCRRTKAIDAAAARVEKRIRSSDERLCVYFF